MPQIVLLTKAFHFLIFAFEYESLGFFITYTWLLFRSSIGIQLKTIFNHIVKLLDVLLDNWRDKLISVSSDGENTMTGRHAGVVTRLEQAASFPILRIWCVPHQVDLIIKSVTKEMSNESFYKAAHAFSVHLRAQANLITIMKSKCPKDTTR